MLCFWFPDVALIKGFRFRYLYGVVGVLVMAWCSTPACAQNARIDSIRQELELATDTIQVRLLYTLGREVADADTSEAERYIQRAIALADSLHFATGSGKARLALVDLYAKTRRSRAERGSVLQQALVHFEVSANWAMQGLVLRRIAVNLRGMRKFAEAKTAFEESLKRYQKTRDIALIARAYYYLGWHLYLRNEFDESIKVYELGLPYADSADSDFLRVRARRGLISIAIDQGRARDALLLARDIEEILENGYGGDALAYNMIGGVYVEHEQYEQALRFFQQCYQAALESNYKYFQETALHNIGYSYRRLKQFDKAEAAFKELLHIKEQPEASFGPYMVWLEMGLLYEELEDYDTALHYLTKVHAYYERTGRRKVWGHALIVKGRIQSKLGNVSEAIRLSKEGIDIVKPLRANLDLRDGYETLHKNYVQQGQYADAYQSQRFHHLYADSVLNAENIRDMGRLEAEFEFEQEQATLDAERRREAQTQTQARQRRNLVLSGIFLVFVLALAGGAVYTKHLGTKNKEIQSQKAQLELQALRLRELDDLKSRFFANISHELRTPLTLIQGHMEDVRNARYGALPEAAAVHLGYSLDQTHRLNRLVEQLLDLARLQNNRLKLRAAQVNLTAFIQRQVAIFDSLAAKHGITLRFMGRGEFVEAYVDEQKLENVFVNLIGNALKFTDAGGVVEVMMKVDREEEQSTGRFVTVEVRDTGIGIPTSDLVRVFDRFYQVDDSSTRHYEGTGVGLALVQDLVQLHGGEVLVTSEVGVGTTFTVRLPLGVEHLEERELMVEEDAKGAVATGSAEALWAGGDGAERERAIHTLMPNAQPDASKEGRILIVEDNADVRAYLVSHLATGFAIVEAANGVEALERLREAEVDLVISDVMMPEMDGFALLEIIKNDPMWRTLPVLMLTARAGEEERLRGLEAKANDYLTKPFRVEELLLRVRNLVDLRRAMVGAFSERVLTVAASAVVEESEEATFLIRAQELVEGHIHDGRFDVEELAKALYMSKATLGRKLKRVTGESPALFMRRLRLERAKEHLENGTYASVQEVALAVGFRDASYFSRVFRKAHGASPAAWMG